jgi:hypothetical protein
MRYVVVLDMPDIMLSTGCERRQASKEGAGAVGRLFFQSPVVVGDGIAGLNVPACCGEDCSRVAVVCVAGVGVGPPVLYGWALIPLAGMRPISA